MLPFKSGSNIVISGCSGCGKTTFVNRLIEHANTMFEEHPTLIIYCYNNWQPIYNEMTKINNNIQFTDQIPTEKEIKQESSHHKHILLICDDKMTTLMTDPFMSHLFTTSSHHYNCSTVLILQNVNCLGKNKSTLSKNCHYSVLMRSPRDYYSIRTLGMQLGDFKRLTEAYKDATTSKWGYLLCDTHPQSDPLYRYRTNIFPDDEALVVYKGM